MSSSTENSLAQVVLIEPEAALRNRVRPHLGGMGEAVDVVATIEEAQARAGFTERLLVLARGRGDPRYAAELACAFDIYAARNPARLSVIEVGRGDLPEGKGATSYLHELDRTLACTQFVAPGGAADASLGLAEDFPHDTYRALARVGELACGMVYLVRNRVSGLKELLVQTRDDDLAAGAVAAAIYRNLRLRAGSCVDMLRHEITRHHSFISSTSLPHDLARQAELAAA
jgi:hypothetical protein